ncbi:MAG: rRNA maturation RNase YbeY [Candidatus Kerfeldbacteria bacterium]|nr:rRNA maturation RNase YbeY [Candidatus Kerfeldbacteria bacterium]
MTAELIKRVHLSVFDETLMRKLLRATERIERCPKKLHTSVAIVSNTEIRKWNALYRRKNYATDVLSFRYSATEAEIIISAQKVRAQAKEYGNTQTEEAAFLFVHGVLHNLGWDHERSEKEARQMREKEVKILNLCGLHCAR